MDSRELKALFDQQAPSYDQPWSTLAALRDGLHLLMSSVLSELPVSARVLCVGAGTGAEIIYLAGRFPQWTFAVVEPSTEILKVCRQRAEAHGLTSRCSFWGRR
jgi:tRNA (cmo5U34)-methyltransferase